MAYIVGTDRYQTRMITTSLDDLISKDNSVRVIDSYVESLDLENLGFIEYSGRNRGQSPYRRSDLLKLHIYGYLNKIRSSRALETEAKRNLELMWLVNCITPDHGTIAGFVQKNNAAFHNTLRNLTLILKGWGLIDGELIVIDGTKIHAQNSKHNCITQTVYNETLNNNEVYKQRRCIVEHPFGTIKRSLGYNFFLRRRQENVDAEAASMFIAYNFKRLLSMFSTEELVMRFE